VKQAEGMAQAAKQIAVIAGADPRLPIMRWSFEQGDETTVPDASGNGFDAACVGKVQFAEGRQGRALKLDGESYLRVDGAGSFNPQSLTISAWVNPDAVNARRGIVVKRVGNTAAPFVFGLSEGALSFEGCDTSGAFWPFNFTGPKLEAGKWSHVAVTLEATKRIVLYLNGQPVATKEITGEPSPNTEPLVIGREAWGGEKGQGEPAFFAGLMDEVKVWKRALSAEEVAEEGR
jgi:hypothetical protein